MTTKRYTRTAPTPQVAGRQFKAGGQYVLGKLVSVVTADLDHPLTTPEEYDAAVAEMGIAVPQGHVLLLDQSGYDPVAWTRDEPFWEDEKGNRRKMPAVTKPVWRYKFKVVSEALVAASDEDLEKLQAAARRAVRAKPRPVVFDTVSMVIVLGDLQVGKVDRRGGTEELLVRIEYAVGEVEKQIKRVKPTEIILVDIGDGLENFESSPGADRTNDLQLMQQMRVFRRICMAIIKMAARYGVVVKFLGVPSNHCSVRRGKQNMAEPEDDMGIEVLTQLADICAENPDAYGLVEFYTPDTHDEALAIELAGGKVLGVAHGHQKTRPENLPAYMDGQAGGRTAMGQADIAVFGHWHNFRVQTYGDDRWIFIAPTMDSGSSWFGNGTGNESAPGIMTLVIDHTGWTDVKVHWAREGIDFEVIG